GTRCQLHSPLLRTVQQFALPVQPVAVIVLDLAPVLSTVYVNPDMPSPATPVAVIEYVLFPLAGVHRSVNALTCLAASWVTVSHWAYDRLSKNSCSVRWRASESAVVASMIFPRFT